MDEICGRKFISEIGREGEEGGNRVPCIQEEQDHLVFFPLSGLKGMKFLGAIKGGRSDKNTKSEQLSGYILLR